METTPANTGPTIAELCLNVRHAWLLYLSKSCSLQEYRKLERLALETLTQAPGPWSTADLFAVADLLTFLLAHFDGRAEIQRLTGRLFAVAAGFANEAPEIVHGRFAVVLDDLDRAIGSDVLRGLRYRFGQELAGWVAVKLAEWPPP
jgi:hypothetical protein